MSEIVKTEVNNIIVQHAEAIMAPCSDVGNIFQLLLWIKTASEFSCCIEYISIFLMNFLSSMFTTHCHFCLPFLFQVVTDGEYAAEVWNIFPGRCNGIYYKALALLWHD